MKPYYAIMLILVFSKSYSQSPNTKKLDETYANFAIEAKEKISNAEENYEIGKKRKAKKLLEEVIAKELSSSFFNGEYSINAASNLLKIDSALGAKYLIEICEQLSASRRAKPDSIGIIHLRNIVKIERQVKKLSGKDFRYPYELIFYFEDLIDRTQPPKRKKGKNMATNQFDSLRVFCFGMGHGLTIITKQDSFLYSFHGNNTIKERLGMEQAECAKISELAKGLAPESIPEIEQPSDGARHYDGADYCYFTMFAKGKEYKSQSYDDFWPAKELQPVVQYIRYLLRKKLNE